MTVVVLASSPLLPSVQPVQCLLNEQGSACAGSLFQYHQASCDGALRGGLAHGWIQMRACARSIPTGVTSSLSLAWFNGGASLCACCSCAACARTLGVSRQLPAGASGPGPSILWPPYLLVCVASSFPALALA